MRGVGGGEGWGAYINISIYFSDTSFFFVDLIGKGFGYLIGFIEENFNYLVDFFFLEAFSLKPERVLLFEELLVEFLRHEMILKKKKSRNELFE